MPLTLKPDLIPPIRDTLETARDILLHIGWTQGEPARDIHGKYVSWRDPRAASFCIYGALDAAQAMVLPHYKYLISDMELDLYVTQFICATRPGVSLLELNDAPTTTRKDMIKVLEDALAHLHPHDHPVG